MGAARRVVMIGRLKGDEIEVRELVYMIQDPDGRMVERFARIPQPTPSVPRPEVRTQEDDTGCRYGCDERGNIRWNGFGRNHPDRLCPIHGRAQ